MKISISDLNARNRAAAALVLAAAVAWLSLATVAEARLGETPDECAGRYGEIVGTFKPVVDESDDEGIHYRQDGIDVRVEFRDGRAWSIMVDKADMTDEEREVILQANADGAAWEGPEEFFGRDYWMMRGGGRLAVHRQLKTTRRLQVITDDYVEAMEDMRLEMLDIVGTAEADEIIDSKLSSAASDSAVGGF